MPASEATYVPRLDTFRAIAALSIVYHHYLGGLLPTYLQLQMSVGIDFFFVLSGFLITGLLLGAKGRCSAILSSFYLRRTARIFPLYYLALSLGLIFQIPGFWQSLPWSPFYLVNVGMIVNNSWFGFVSHFWTLAVEEQFYLLWPILLLGLGSRVWIFAVLWIVAAMGYRYIVQAEATNLFLNMTVLGTGDELMIGSLAALSCKEFGAVRVERMLRPLLLISVPALMVAMLVGIVTLVPNWFRATFIPPLAALAFVWLTVRAWRDGPDGNSWGGKILPAIGLISYGIYVWHFLLLWPCTLLEQLGYPVVPTRLLGIAVTLVVSWLSFRFFETPLRQFGKRLASKLEAPEPVPSTVSV